MRLQVRWWVWAACGSADEGAAGEKGCQGGGGKGGHRPAVSYRTPGWFRRAGKRINPHSPFPRFLPEGVVFWWGIGCVVDRGWLLCGSVVNHRTGCPALSWGGLVSFQGIVMPPSADIVSLPSIKVQKYHDGGWVWNEVAWGPGSVTGPPETGGLQWLPNTYNFSIPWEQSPRPILILGEYAAINGTWDLKVRVGDSSTSFVEYTPQLNAGTFELVIPALGFSNAAWVWYSSYIHTPANMFGISVHNCMRITTASA